MTDIDWLAVDMVVSGARLKLRPDEKRAVVRVLANRMMALGDSVHGTSKLTSADLAQRLGTTQRSVDRYKAELDGGTESDCPVCRHQMWTVNGTVLPHADSLFTECPMTGSGNRPNPFDAESANKRTGLAAERPDLYAWLDEVSA